MTMPLRRLITLASLAAFGAAPLRAEAPASRESNPAPAESRETIGRITLVDEQATQVVSLLEKISGRIALRSGDLPPAKINFNSGRDLSRAEAEAALESLLALNGVAVIPDGDKFIKVVPAAKGRDPVGEAPSLHLDPLPESVRGEAFVSRLITLRHIPYASVDPAVQAVVNKSRGGSAIALAAANAVLVTDSVSNVRRIETLLNRADIAGKVLFFPLKNTRAADILKQLKALQASGLKSAFAGEVGFEAGEVGNQILAFTSPANESRIREIIMGIDVESAPATRSELITLRHAESSDVVELVRSIATGNTGAVGTAGRPGTAARSSSAPRSSASGSKATGADITSITNSRRSTDNADFVLKKPANDDDGSFSPTFTAVADTRSNAIVVYGTDRDIRQIRDLVSKIDVRLAQVRLEVAIVEVTLGTAQASGLETLGLGFYTGTQGVAGGRKNGDVNFNGATTGLPSQSGPGKPPIAISGSLKDFSLQTVFNKARDDSRVKLLSSPTVVASHNTPAGISVGQRQPIITGITNSTVTAGTTTSTVEYQDIGLEVTIIPRIGANGVVEMDVFQKNGSVIGTTTIDGNPQPIIGNRQASSYLTAASGETVVLAGLQSFTETKTKGKVWLLGDIPLLGSWLFQPESTLSQKTELIIFIKPVVLPSGDLVGPETPGFREGSLTKTPASERVKNGVFTEVTRPNTIFEEQEAEAQKQRERNEAEKASAKAAGKLDGMHD